MELTDLTGDVTLSGDQIAAFCDLVASLNQPQAFDLTRLRTATRIYRRQSLQETEWRVALSGNRGTVVIPIVGT